MKALKPLPPQLHAEHTHTHTLSGEQSGHSFQKGLELKFRSYYTHLFVFMVCEEGVARFEQIALNWLSLTN